jgi:hypothetical protein
MDRREAAALDHHITGNYGEDQMKHDRTDSEIEEMETAQDLQHDDDEKKQGPYDDKCGDLARHFLMDHALDEATYRAQEKVLAGVIQQAIEEWLEEYFAPHQHECQQCSKIVVEDCTCTRGQYMTWCSSNCRAAYDF